MLALVGALVVIAIARKGAFFPPYDVLVPLAALAVAAVAIRRRPLLDRTDALVMGALLAFALWWTADASWRGSLSETRMVVGSAIGFAACFAIGRTFGVAQRHALRTGAVVVGAVEATIGIVGVALRIEPLALPAHQHLRAAGTLTYSNAMGALLAVLLVVAITTPASRWRDAALVLLAGGVLATQSRGVLLAVVLALVLVRRRLHHALVPLGLGVILGLVTVAGSGDGHRHVEVLVLATALPILAAGLPIRTAGSRRQPRPLVTAAVALLLSVGALLLLSGGLRAAVHSRLNTGSIVDRTGEWRAAWGEFADSPLLGSGPDARLGLADGRTARLAHNEPLQVAADTGLIGLALIGLAFAAPLVARRSRARVVGAPAVLTVFTVCALPDYPWHVPAITMTAGLLLTGLPTADGATTRASSGEHVR